MRTFTVTTREVIESTFTVELPDDTPDDAIEELVNSALGEGEAQFNFEDRYDWQVEDISEEK